MGRRRPFARAFAARAFAATAALAAALCSASLAADEGEGAAARRPFLGVDALVGTPSARADVFGQAFFGASARFLASRNVEIGLDYLFMGYEYYYPESPSGPWKGPVKWGSVPSRFSGLESSWIFYHTKHYVSPMACYVNPLEEYGIPVSIRVGAGPALSIVVPSDASSYYPGLAAAFEEFDAASRAYLGVSAKLGLEWRPWRCVRLGFEYLFVVDSLESLGRDLGRLGAVFFERAGNLVVFAGLRI